MLLTSNMQFSNNQPPPPHSPPNPTNPETIKPQENVEPVRNQEMKKSKKTDNKIFLVAMRLGDTPVPIPNTMVKT